MTVNTLLLFLFQTPSPSPLQTPHVPERMPALFTLIYVGGFGLVLLLLLLGLVRNRRRSVAAAVSEDLLKSVHKRLGSTSKYRGVISLSWLFVLLSVRMLCFYVDWATGDAERG